MSNQELIKKIESYAELRRLAAEVSDEMDAIADEIKTFMGDSEELSVAGYKVSYAKYETTRFDTTTFKKEHSAMYEQYVKKSTARRFAVKA